MGNILITQMQIDLQKAKKEYQKNEFRAMSLITDLQKYGKPYFNSPDELYAEEIKQIADDLLLVKEELIKVYKRIKFLQNELGEG